jgi:hypothetical protein
MASRPPFRLILISVALHALALAILTAQLTAQSAVDSRLSYDVAREITLSGTVSAVLTRPGPGMIMGSHLLLNTVSGTVDASLGRWGLQGDGALVVAPGQQLEVTGIMRTLMGKEVFLTRTVKSSGKIHTMRNIYGIPLSPQARQRAARSGELQ